MSLVKYFHSGMTGAPALTGVAGSLISVLDACLVNGFGTVEADSLTVAAGVATMVINAGHSFEVDTVANVNGAVMTALNGDHKVIAVSPNTVSYVATGVPDMTDGGTITAKLTPLGFAKAFEQASPQVAAYRSSDVTGTRFYLRVSDSDTSSARVIGYESMTGHSTGTGLFPTTAQLNGGKWWIKTSGSSNATPRLWAVIGDSKGFFIYTQAATSTNGQNGSLNYFGDFNPSRAGDVFACALTGAPEYSGNDLSQTVYDASYSYTNTPSSPLMQVALARSFTGLGAAVRGTHRSESFFSSSYESGAGFQGYAYPNGPDNTLLLSRSIVHENDQLALRGHYRGLHTTPQPCHASFAYRDKIDGQGPFAGRKFMAIKSGIHVSSTSNAVTFIDITGPW